jgi:hypothetical protein
VQAYFLSLFAAQAVLLGVAVAFIVAFVQISAGKYSPALASLSLSDRWTRVLLALQTVAMVLMAGVSLILSLPTPRPLILGMSVNTERDLVGAAGLLILILSIISVASIVIRAQRYANSRHLARLVVDRLPYSSLLADSQTARVSIAVLPLVELATQAIRDGDRPTFAAILERIGAQWSSWLAKAATQDRESIFVANFVESVLNGIPELIARSGVPSLHRVYLPSVCRYAQELVDKPRGSLKTILEHVERTAVTLLLDKEEFAATPAIFSLFELDKASGGNEESRAEIHRVLAGIGRTVGRLLPNVRGFVFHAPGFGYLDESRSEAISALTEGYWNLRDDREEHTNSDDHFLWIEAMEVTIAALLESAVAHRRIEVFRDHIDALLSDMVSAAAFLAYLGYHRPLQLTILALKRFAESGLQAEDRLWSSLSEYTMKLGAIAEDLAIDWFMGGSAADEAISVLGLTPASHWSSAALETTIHPLPADRREHKHDSSWAFIRRAGVRLGSNFGMMFDSLTGETYPEDDPRRRL